MTSWKIPTQKQIDKALSQLGKPQLFRYFFEKLENPFWVKPLWEKDFFKNPPQIIKREENNLIQIPLWPESRYLARMASKNPEDVFEVISALPKTKNSLVLEDIVDSALAMPPNLAAKIGEKILLEKEPFGEFLSVKLGKLISHIAKGGEIEFAFRLAKTLLDLTTNTISEEYSNGKETIPRRSESSANIDKWTYIEILKNNYPDLINTSGIKAIDLLCGILNKALKIKSQNFSEDQSRDYSYIWRKSIRNHKSSVGRNSLKYNLVTAITKGSENIIGDDPTQVPALTKIFKKYNFDIFSRITLHILTLSPKEYSELISEYLSGLDLINNYTCRHEFFLLLETRFSYLPEEKQKLILSLIENGPKKLPKEKSSDYEIHKKYWQRNLLWRLKKYLSGEWKNYFDHLIKELGKPSFEEFSDRGAIWVGPTSPKSIQELKGLSIEEIADFLKNWQYKDELKAPSPEGLKRVLVTTISLNPKPFAENAELFQGTEPTYIRALIDGFCEALSKDNIFPWEKVLNFCLWGANQNGQIPQKHQEQLEKDIGWGFSRTSIIRLIISGINKDHGGINFGDREIVWSILQPLTEDPDPTPKNEEEFLESSGPLSIAINSTRGNAIEAVIKYSLWVKQNLENKNSNLDFGFKTIPEAKEVLESHLNWNKDPSLAIRSIYGQYFPWIHLLDKGWTQKQIDQIFPMEEKHQLKWEAAWDAFINHCEPYKDIFDTLLPKYVLAVSRLGISSNFKELNHGREEHLTEHLTIYFLRGKFSLEDTQNPFVSFWGKASKELKLHSLSYLGRILFDTEEIIEADALARLKKLWEWRLEQINIDSSYSDFIELSSFGWWFSSKQFESTWALPMLKKALQKSGKIKTSHNVVKKLSELDVQFLKEAIVCFDMILESDKDGWKIIGWMEEAKALLKRGLNSDEAKLKAKSTIHKLGEKGYFEFGELLK
jgi:hypothetical protein